MGNQSVAFLQALPEAVQDGQLFGHGWDGLSVGGKTSCDDDYT
jgi:hypothetical protein